MNIDWSKAPEDATHAGTTTRIQIPVFYKDIREDKYSYWHADGDGWREEAIGHPACTPVIERPKKQEAWDGDVLPPVGVICEHEPYEMRNDHHKVEIIAHKKASLDVAVFWDEERQIVSYSSYQSFRPIKTAEQLAEEEIQAIRDEIRWQKPQLGPCPVAQLYNKGYRKQ